MIVLTRVTPIVKTELDAHGNLVRAWVPSESQPETMYEMVRGWKHVGADVCEAFRNGAPCYHVRALEALEGGI